MVAEGIGKVFSHRGAPIDVLRGVSLTVRPGDRIAVVGKSGTGKSTLLHVLGTLVAPSEGTLLFAGEDVFAYRENALAAFRNREIGFVFQFHYLMLEFTAVENVMMPALIAGVSRREARSGAMELLERVGLADRATHKPGQLSGGEQQRVSIARALMMRPKLLLTDEMTGNLDPVTGQQIFDLVQQMHRERGTAIISVTHDEAMAAAYDRVYRLKDGVLLPDSKIRG